jgi:hypothetical protein
MRPTCRNNRAPISALASWRDGTPAGPGYRSRDVAVARADRCGSPRNLVQAPNKADVGVGRGPGGPPHRNGGARQAESKAVADGVAGRANIGGVKKSGDAPAVSIKRQDFVKLARSVPDL